MLTLALCLAAAMPHADAETASKATPATGGTVCPICHHANNQQATYPQRAGGALMRGAMNTTFGWTELLTRPAEEVKTGGNLIAGVGSGVGRATKRTFMGIGELFTFWVPKGRQGYLNLTTDCPICMGIRTSPTTPPDTAAKN